MCQGCAGAPINEISSYRQTCGHLDALQGKAGVDRRYARQVKENLLQEHLIFLDAADYDPHHVIILATHRKAFNYRWMIERCALQCFQRDRKSTRLNSSH